MNELEFNIVEMPHGGWIVCCENYAIPDDNQEDSLPGTFTPMLYETEKLAWEAAEKYDWSFLGRDLFERHASLGNKNAI